MNKIFNIDYKRQVLLLLPTFLRKEVLVAFLRAMTAPVVTDYNSFLTNRNNNLYRARMNGQVCYLRRVLNDAFPEANGAIRIEDGVIAGKWLYAHDESSPEQLFITDEGTVFHDESAMTEGVHDFMVIVPLHLKDKEGEDGGNYRKLRALLNYYKLPSKSYTIIYE